VTTPDERTRALLETKTFLQSLMSSEETPGVPEQVRRDARWLLRHFPNALELHSAHLACPRLFAATRPRPEASPEQ
jgi:hypothetical protein